MGELLVKEDGRLLEAITRVEIVCYHSQSTLNNKGRRLSSLALLIM